MSVFQHLRTHFPKLSYSDHTDLCYIDVEKELQPAKEETIKLIKEVLGNKKFAYRGDYTRFLKSVLALLTGDTTDFKLEGLGAISSARWMAKETGAIDLFLMKSKIFKELDKNMVMTEHQSKLIGRFVKFIALVFVKWWVRVVW